MGLLCPLQFLPSDPKQVVELGERFRSPRVPGHVHVPRLSTLLHSLLQLQLQGEGNQRSSGIWGEPPTEYFVTDYLWKGKRADCCLAGATANALLLLQDCSKTSSESKMPPASQRGKYREKKHPQRLRSSQGIPLLLRLLLHSCITSGEGERVGEGSKRPPSHAPPASLLRWCPPLAQAGEL